MMEPRRALIRFDMGARRKTVVACMMHASGCMNGTVCPIVSVRFLVQIMQALMMLIRRDTASNFSVMY